MRGVPRYLCVKLFTQHFLRSQYNYTVSAASYMQYIFPSKSMLFIRTVHCSTIFSNNHQIIFFYINIAACRYQYRESFDMFMSGEDNPVEGRCKSIKIILRYLKFQDSCVSTRSEDVICFLLCMTETPN